MPAVNLISTVPVFVSPEEHVTAVASTPNSFSDIQPVIRHKEENVSVTLDPPLEGFSDGTAVQGTLYVLTSVLAFMPSTSSSGFQIEYPTITLHAVSRGELGPSIYCQLDESFGVSNGTKADADGEEDAEMRELNIVPQNASSLEAIFEALSQCASLHPDPQDDEDDLDDAFIDVNGANGSSFETFTGDENEELSEVGRAALEYMESIIDDPHGFKPGEDDGEEKVEVAGAVSSDPAPDSKEAEKSS